jgi:uncharacterized protein YndB with AHSA1/START domain
MATAFITPDQNSVISEIEIAAPPDRVFAALIDPEQCKQWGSAGSFQATLWKMDARPGGAWRFISHERGKKEEFVHHGEVLEVDPPRLLVYTWFASWHDNPNLQTTVRWELTATSTGTRLKVTHSGFAQDATARQGYSGGWPGLLQAIKDYIEK